MRVTSAQYLRSAVHPKDFLEDGRPQVAFVGRSNVGKSTLLNRLAGRNALARISSTPGRTRAINYFDINSRFYFVDLPGYGYAKVSKSERASWAKLMESYLESAADRALVVQLVDAKVGATELDRQSAAYLHALGIEPIVIATKADRVKKGKRAGALGAIARELEVPAATVLPFGAPTGEGVKAVWKAIERYLESFEEQRLRQSRQSQ